MTLFCNLFIKRPSYFSLDQICNYCSCEIICCCRCGADV